MTEPDEILLRTKHLICIRRGRWEFVSRPSISGVVGIIAVTEDRRLILVEQHRIPVNCNVIELPAGLAGDVAGSESEDLAAAARRELREETGYEAGEMIELAAGPTSAGLTDEMVTLFLARKLRKVGDGGGDAGESITVHEIPIAEVEAWVAGRRAGGMLIDLKVYAALHFAR